MDTKLHAWWQEHNDQLLMLGLHEGGSPRKVLAKQGLEQRA